MFRIKYPLISFFVSLVLVLIAVLFKLLNISGNNMFLAASMAAQVLSLIWLFAVLLRIRG